MSRKKKKINRIFQPNLIYVFSYKKYKQAGRQLKLRAPRWPRELNGQLVISNVARGRTGTILGTGYSININWCKCIGRKV